jgi:hypothetical protein
VFKNKDYYRENMSMGVRDIIRRFEDIRTSAGVEEIQGCGLGGPEKSVMKQYLERKSPDGSNVRAWCSQKTPPRHRAVGVGGA